MTNGLDNWTDSPNQHEIWKFKYKVLPSKGKIKCKNRGENDELFTNSTDNCTAQNGQVINPVTQWCDAISNKINFLLRCIITSVMCI